jgi:hypothetical protein
MVSLTALKLCPPPHHVRQFSNYKKLAFDGFLIAVAYVYSHSIISNFLNQIVDELHLCCYLSKELHNALLGN